VRAVDKDRGRIAVARRSLSNCRTSRPAVKGDREYTFLMSGMRPSVEPPAAAVPSDLPLPSAPLNRTPAEMHPASDSTHPPLRPATGARNPAAAEIARRFATIARSGDHDHRS